MRRIPNWCDMVRRSHLKAGEEYQKREQQKAQMQLYHNKESKVAVLELLMEPLACLNKTLKYVAMKKQTHWNVIRYEKETFNFIFDLLLQITFSLGSSYRMAFERKID